MHQCLGTEQPLALLTSFFLSFFAQLISLHRPNCNVYFSFSFLWLTGLYQLENLLRLRQCCSIVFSHFKGKKIPISNAKLGQMRSTCSLNAFHITLYAIATIINSYNNQQSLNNGTLTFTQLFSTQPVIGLSLIAQILNDKELNTQQQHSQV